jgi:hypothetical protein
VPSNRPRSPLSVTIYPVHYPALNHSHPALAIRHPTSLLGHLALSCRRQSGVTGTETRCRLLLGSLEEVEQAPSPSPESIRPPDRRGTEVAARPRRPVHFSATGSAACRVQRSDVEPSLAHSICSRHRRRVALAVSGPAPRATKPSSFGRMQLGTKHQALEFGAARFSSTRCVHSPLGQPRVTEDAQPTLTCRLFTPSGPEHHTPTIPPTSACRRTQGLTILNAASAGRLACDRTIAVGMYECSSGAYIHGRIWLPCWLPGGRGHGHGLSVTGGVENRAEQNKRTSLTYHTS